MTLDGSKPAAGIEPWQDDRRVAGVEGEHQAEHPADVERRDAHHGDVRRAVRIERRAVGPYPGCEGVVAHRDRLGYPRRAAREQDQRVGVAAWRRCGSGGRPPGLAALGGLLEHQAAVTERLAQRAMRLRTGHTDLRASGDVDQLRQLTGGEQRVHLCSGGAEAGSCNGDGRAAHATPVDQRDPVVPLDTAACQRCGPCVGLGPELAVRAHDRLDAVDDQRRPLCCQPCRRVDEPGDVGRHLLLRTSASASAHHSRAARWSSTDARPAPIVFTAMCVAPASRQRPAWSTTLSLPLLQLTRPSMPKVVGSRPASRAACSITARALSRWGPGGTCGNHPSASRPVRRSAASDVAPTHTGIGRCTGRGREAGPGHLLELSVVGDRPLGPEPPKQRRSVRTSFARGSRSPCRAPRIRRRSNPARPRGGTGRR